MSDNHKNTLKTAWNDITGDTIKTGKGSQTKYADNWESIFGKKEHAIQTPPPDSLEEYLKQEREAHECYDKLFREELPMEVDQFVAEDEYMCPNCVTPWKCNGPHIDEDEND